MEAAVDLFLFLGRFVILQSEPTEIEEMGFLF